MPQRCIGTQPSDSPRVGSAVKVSKDTSFIQVVASLRRYELYGFLVIASLV